MYYEKDGSMVARNIAGETILVPIRQNVGDLSYMYSLNDVGTYIWEFLNGGKKLEEIVSALVQQYEVEGKRAEADVLDFLAQMKAIGAIREKGN